jgi:beta-catenin-like protein 1
MNATVSGDGNDFVHDEVVNAADVRRLVKAAVQAFNANAVLRTKHVSQPARFAESEVDLDARIRALGALATQPALFGDAVTVGLPDILVQLLDHENLDVVASVIAVLVDLVDPDVEEDQSPYSSMIDALLAGGVFQSLVSVLEGRLRGTATDTAAGDAEVILSATVAALSIMENVLEVRPDLADTLGCNCGLVQYCIRVLEASSGYTERGSAVVEVLAILLQTSDGRNREEFGKVGGLDCILRAISGYRKGTAKLLGDEGETVANMFSVLCASMLRCRANKVRFTTVEGVELMLLILRSGSTRLRDAVLRALDFACTDCEVVVRRLFDTSGIGVLFSILMALDPGGERASATARTRVSAEQGRSEVGHVIGILFHLFRYGDAPCHERLVSKLTESGGSKMQKVLLLYLEALDEEAGEGDDGSNPSEDSGEARGSFVCQLGSVVIAHVATLGPPSLVGAVEQSLTDVGGLAMIASRVRTFANYFETDEDALEKGELDDASSSHYTAAERERLSLIAKGCERLGSVSAKSTVDYEKG